MSEENNTKLPVNAQEAGPLRVDVQVFLQDELGTGEKVFDEVFQFSIASVKPDTTEGWLQLATRLQMLTAATQNLAFADYIEMLECCIGYAHGAKGFSDGLAGSAQPKQVELSDLSNARLEVDEPTTRKLGLDAVKLERVPSELEIVLQKAAQECASA